jgi:hypothetical protein
MEVGGCEGARVVWRGQNNVLKIVTQIDEERGR